MSFVVGLDSSGEGNNWTSVNLAGQDVMPDTPTNNFCTLNPLDKGSYATLTQGNLRNDHTGHSTIAERRVLGTMAYSTSDTQGYYWEVLYVANDREDLQTIGVQHIGTINGQSSNATNNIHAGEGQFGLTWNTAEAVLIYYPWDPNNDLAGGVTGGGSDNAGVLVGIAVKGSNIWLRINGAWVTGTSGTGNPATGAYPTYTAVADGIYTPMGAPWQGHSGGSGGAVHWRWNFGQNGTFTGEKTAQGNADGNGYGDFYYSVPAGFFALCSKNLPTPTIKEPGDYFNTITYTGNGSDDHDISGVGFQPDFTWISAYNQTHWNRLVDSVRGAGNALRTDGDAASSADTSNFKAFLADGFRLGLPGNDYNMNTAPYVAWNWLAGTAPTADNSSSAGAAPTAGSVKIDGSNFTGNLAGSIAATRISANTTSGFSIVTYAGGAGTVAHGLGVAPNIVIQKKHDATSDWLTYIDVVDGSADYMRLNTTAAAAAADPETLATSTVFSSLTGSNNVVAYCFAEVEGFSRIGFYEGDNADDGPFVYTGFTPAYLLVKYADNADESWWLLSNKLDTYNPTGIVGWANLTSTFYDYGEMVDFLSNGFKINENNGGINGYSPGTYTFMAFAESPFKYSNAR